MLKISSIRSILESTLFVWIGLTLVITLAGNSLLLPDWLQVVGRSHPILLHFPIVLLLMGLLFFWIPGVDKKPEIREMGEISFLAGCNFAGITVLAGLILAQEDYTGEILTWHKWGGLIVFGGCVILYFYRSMQAKVIRLSSIALAIAVILTGHWGAGLTHGEDFLLAPIQSNNIEVIPLAEAEIFGDVVQPILQAKCISCHKEGKIKGELRMDHLEGLQKGGKSGPFVLAGDFEKSLLIQRINLPEDNKKHMPPKNKAQLSDEEFLILSEWVASGASFEQKLVTLPAKNELYQLASVKFEGNKIYSFDAADPKDVDELNTSFRSVQSIFPESPALDVSYFGISAFQPNSLSDLKKVKNQIVRFSLNKMPLAGIDLKFLKDFKHLEELQLNFTDLDTDQLKLISELNSLEVLAVSGNIIDEISLKNLTKLKSLKKLYLWQTGLSDGEKVQLMKDLPETQIEFGFDGSKIIYDLNSPAIISEVNMFSDSAELKMTHPIKTVEIRYTTDGEEPDSISSPIYNGPIWIKRTAEVKARAFAKDWKGSPSSSTLLFRSGNPPAELKLLSEPNASYFGKGGKTLIDQIKGKNNHTSGEWLGYQDKDPELEITLAEGQKPKELTISLLYHEGAYIFPPTEVEIWVDTNGVWKKIVDDIPTQSKDIKPSRFEALNYPMPDESYHKVKIKMKTIRSLPKWHPGAGSKGWVFIDEISILD